MMKRNTEMYNYFINHIEISLYIYNMHIVLLYECRDIMYLIIASHSATSVGIIML